MGLVKRHLLVKKNSASSKKKKQNEINILKTLFVFFMISVPLGIEFLADTSYLTSFLLIGIAYPIYYAVFCVFKKTMKCKTMP